MVPLEFMIEIIGGLDREAKTAEGGRISLHQQLVGRLRNSILSGRLPTGTYLSSSRALATELGVSRNTVILAYEQLAAEGYIVTDQSGTKVSNLNIENRPPSQSLISEMHRPELAKRWQLMDRQAYRPLSTLALLTPGLPSLDDFPLKAWQRSLDRMVKGLSLHYLGKKEPLGVLPLREAIARHLHISRGVNCDETQIVITDGAQQAIELCISLISNPKDEIWIEEPCYSGAKVASSSQGLTVVPMRVDEEGINIPRKHWNDKVPKLIWTSPAHQYPTGAVLSISRRLELIENAKKTSCWIIEDDYDGDFRHFGSPISSLQGLVDRAPVIYIGSFSKTMYPNIRIGFMVLPKSLLIEVEPILNRILQSSNHIQQLALADFINRGEFGRHLARMRRLYRERQKVLKESLALYFPEYDVLGGSAGMHLTLVFPRPMDDQRIALRAHEMGIEVHALSTFYLLAEECKYGLVIGYGNTPKNKIPDTIYSLSKLINSIK